MREYRVSWYKIETVAFEQVGYNIVVSIATVGSIVYSLANC